jgi:hypothetical protein
MKSPTKTIWKTVVFAGAMLAFPACGGKSNTAPAAPDNTGGTEEVAPEGTGEEMPADPCAGDPCGGVSGGDPCADPCGDRDRGGGEDEGGVGRGFILS